MDMRNNILRKALLALLMTTAGTTITAQEKTLMATLYSQYKPATITLSDGRVIKNSLTNVFLKNSSLLYLHNTTAMEAKMTNISRVDFDDRWFVNIENQLATVIDSVGENVLYRVDYLDIDSYNANLKNNLQITDITFSDNIQTTSIDLSNEEDYKLPVVHKYYYRLNGEIVTVHEREIQRRLSKEKKRMFKTIIDLPDFSWEDDASVLQLLKAISD